MGILKLALASSPKYQYNKEVRFSKNVKQVSKFLLRGVLVYPHIKRLDENISGEYRDLLFNRHPAFLTKCMRPYIYQGLKKQTLVDMLIEHHQWVSKHFSIEQCQQLFTDGIKLVDLPLKDEENQYFIKMIYHSRYWKEGEFSLMLSDQNGINYYVISFTLLNNKAYVGGIQGPENDNGFSKMATKSLHGLRPKSLMVETLCLFLRKFNIDGFFGVKNSAHTYTSWRYLSKNITFDFDGLWLEQGATSYNKYLYSVPLIAERKDPTTLKNRQKRKLYRLRYEWLDQYQQQIFDELEQYSH